MHSTTVKAKLIASIEVHIMTADNGPIRKQTQC